MSGQVSWVLIASAALTAVFAPLPVWLYGRPSPAALLRSCCSLSHLSCWPDVQNLTSCQVCPPLPVSSSCPSMSP
jgi:hypothetical protein